MYTGMKRFLVLFMCLSLMPWATASAGTSQAVITIDGVRTAFFSPDGNYLPAIEQDGVLYVPAESLGENLGIQVTADRETLAVKINGVRAAFFDKSGAFLPPLKENDIVYVPLAAFCESAGITLNVTENGYAMTRGEKAAATALPTTAPVVELYGRVPLTLSNYTDYFDLSQSCYAPSGYPSPYYITFTAAIQATTGYDIVNVRFTLEQYGVVSVPASGRGTASYRTESIYGGKSSKENILKITNAQTTAIITAAMAPRVKDVSGYIRMSKAEADAANEKLYINAAGRIGLISTSSSYDGVIDMLSALSEVGYKDSAEQLKRARQAKKELLEKEKKAAEEAKEKKNAEAYQAAMAALESADYDKAVLDFEALGDYQDSAAQAVTAKEKKNARAYQEAMAALSAGNYDQAINGFEALGDYQDSKIQAEEAREKKNDKAYQAALVALEAEKYDKAISGFEALGNYRDSAKKAAEAKNVKNAAAYQKAVELMEKGKFAEAQTAYEELAKENYEDSAVLALLANAKALIKAEKRTGYAKAVTLLENHLDHKELKALYDLSRFRAAYSVEAPNAKGTPVFEPSKPKREPYTYCMMNRNGDILVRDQDKTAISYYNEQGKKITTKKYHQEYDRSKTDLLYFVGDYALTYSAGNACLVSREGKEISLSTAYRYDSLAGSNLLSYSGKGGHGLVDFNGKVIVKPKFYNRVRFEQGYAVVDRMSKNKRQYAVINEKGKTIFDFGKYDTIGVLGNDLFLATKKDSKGNAVRTIINAKGQTVRKAGTFGTPIRPVGDYHYLGIPDSSGRYGLYDSKLNQLLPNKYTEIKEIVQDSCLIVANKSTNALGQYGDFKLCDMQGKVISGKHIYDEIAAAPDSPFIAAKDKDDYCWYLLDLEGNVIY